MCSVSLIVFCVAVEEQGAPVSVELEKGAGGVGFTLEGGKGSIHGDRPLVINRIFNGTLPMLTLYDDIIFTVKQFPINSKVFLINHH